MSLKLKGKSLDGMESAKALGVFYSTGEKYFECVQPFSPEGFANNILSAE